VNPELGRVTDRKPPFKYSAIARVWFSDTDAQGIVYYGRYLPYFDHARTEYHRHLGGSGPWIAGRDFVMRASTVEYLARRPVSTTCSRSSSGQPGSAARARPTSAPPTGWRTTS
jgi:hypothetical protein